jgi:hypothetical protein
VCLVVVLTEAGKAASSGPAPPPHDAAPRLAAS